MSDEAPPRRGIRRGRWWAYTDIPQVFFDDRPLKLAPAEAKVLIKLIRHGTVASADLLPGKAWLTNRTMHDLRHKLPEDAAIVNHYGSYELTTKDNGRWTKHQTPPHVMSPRLKTTLAPLLSLLGRIT